MAAVVAGTVERLWYLARTPLNADEAVVGLMAEHILAGHTYAFYWGQHYGGVEPYLVSGLFALFGPSAVALRAVPTALSIVAAILVWRVARRLTSSPTRAVVAAAVVWAVPQTVVWNATLEYGFRGITMACGLGVLLLVLRITSRPRPGWDVVVLGVVAGVGWWSSPEIVYFLVPGGLWLAGWMARRRVPATVLLGWLAPAVAAAAVGALPWLWDNVGSGFPSLRTSSYYVPAGAPGYAGRLAIFIRDVVPMLLDLRTPSTGAWTVPPTVGASLAVVVVVAMVALVAGRLVVRARPLGVPGRPLPPGSGQVSALVFGVVAFPFLWAMVPGVWLWESGRYAVFLVPLVVLLVVAGLEPRRAGGLPAVEPASGGAGGPVVVSGGACRPVVVPGSDGVAGQDVAGRRSVTRRRQQVRRRKVAGQVAAVMMAGAIGLGAVDAAHLVRAVDPPGVVLGHGFDPNVTAQTTAVALRRAGVTTGFADYWVAYDLDFVSRDRLRIADAPPSPDRWPGLVAEVRAQPAVRQSWLFLRPGPRARAQYVQSAVLQGPGGLAEATFVADLDRLGVTYRIHQIGSVAVVTPSRPVRFAAVGLVSHRTG